MSDCCIVTVYKHCSVEALENQTDDNEHGFTCIVTITDQVALPLATNRVHTVQKKLHCREKRRILHDVSLCVTSYQLEAFNHTHLREE